MPSFNLNSHLLLFLLFPTVSHWASKLQHMNLGGHHSVHITHGWLYVLEYITLSKQDLMLIVTTAFKRRSLLGPQQEDNLDSACMYSASYFLACTLTLQG